MTKSVIYRRYIFFFFMVGGIISCAVAYLFYSYSCLLADYVEEEFVSTHNDRTIARINDEIGYAQQALTRVRDSQVLVDYFAEPSAEHIHKLNELFVKMLRTEHDYYQIRLLSVQGLELLNMTKAPISSAIMVQEPVDFSTSPYFQEIQTHPSNVWFSAIDLNSVTQYGKSDVPTLRIALPIRHNALHLGYFMLNINAQSLLDEVIKSPYIDIYLIDNKGNFIYSSNQIDRWSGYFKHNQTLSSIFHMETRFLINEMHNKGLHFIDLTGYVPNRQHVFLISRLKKTFIKELRKKALNFIAAISIITFVILILTAIWIAMYSNRKRARLELDVQESNQYIKLLDQYVPIVEFDKNGRIIRCNQAYCQVCQCGDTDIIGELFPVFCFREQAKITDMWDTVKRGLPWQRELHHVNQDNKEFWLFTTVIPCYDYQHEVRGYMAISIDKTEKKIIEMLSEIDTLTNVYNRAKMDKCLEQEAERARRYNTKFSLIMLDIDFFKSVNDNHGHLTGDKVLNQIASIMGNNTRMNDDVGRWGGEEFIIICPETCLENAVLVADKIRKAIEAYDFDEVGHVTISCGVETYDVQFTITNMLEKVDFYLYQAKQLGRNCVVSRLGRLPDISERVW